MLRLGESAPAGPLLQTRITAAEYPSSRVTVYEAYEGRTGRARPIAATATSKVHTPSALTRELVKKAGNAIKNANDADAKQFAIASMTQLAARYPTEVREAMQFAFATPPHSLNEYEAQTARTLGADAAARLMDDTRDLACALRKGASRIALVSATFSSGGVAEMFRTQAHILRQFGVTTEWQKTWAYDDRYGEIGRKAFDAFQGGKTLISDAEHAHWHDHNMQLAAMYQGIATDKRVRTIAIEDHHFSHAIARIKELNPEKRILWRSHVDMAGVLEGRPAGRAVWERAILPNLKLLGPNDLVLFQPGSVPPEAQSLNCPVFTAPPGIDLLAPKNDPISWPKAVRMLQELAPGIDVDRAHIVAGGRFVPWKGLLPLLRAFIAIADEFPEADLLLFGVVGSDDWRKVAYNNQLQAVLRELEATRPNVYKRIVQVINKSAELSAIFTLAAHHQMPCCLPSLAEGYNITAAEAACHGAVPATTFQGGLRRFHEDPATAFFGVDIHDLVKTIDEPTTIYSIEGDKLVATPVAQALESAFTDMLRRILRARRDDPGYAAKYAAAATVAKKMAVEASLLAMSRDYMAAMVASPRILRAAASGPSALGAPLLSSVARALAA